MIVGVVCFVVGVVAGCLSTLNLQKRRALAASRVVIHIRSAHPGVYRDRLCEICRNYGIKRFAEYIDQNTRAWCGDHLPRTTRYAERAVNEGDGHATGTCMAHGMDCPKPWSLV